jgi:hypothetical protein
MNNPIIKVQNARLSFPVLFTPKAETDEQGQPKAGKPKFSVTLLLDKKVNAKNIAEIRAAIETVKKSDKLKGQKKAPKLPLREGSEKSHLDGYNDDNMFISARTTNKPGVVDRNLEPIDEASGRIYAGCYVNAVVEVYPYVHPKSGPGITFSFRNVQFLRDGEPFGEKRVAASEDFDAVEDSADSLV